MRPHLLSIQSPFAAVLSRTSTSGRLTRKPAVCSGSPFSARLLDLPTLTSLLPTPTGELTEDHIVGEIGELLNGDVQGRQAEEEVTLFKSLGCALEDLTAAAAVHAKATEAAPRL